MPWQQTRLVAFPWQKKRTSELRMIDVLLAQDEIHMVRYRLELHAPVTERVIIAEAEWTHTGQRKPLHVREALTAAEIDQYKIHLCVINFSASALLHVQKLANRSKYGHNVGGSHPQHSFLHLRKLEQRIQLNQVVVAELRTLRARQTSINAPTRLVHFSDVDELLDIRMLQSTHASLGNRELAIVQLPAPQGFDVLGQLPCVPNTLVPVRADARRVAPQRTRSRAAAGAPHGTRRHERQE